MGFVTDIEDSFLTEFNSSLEVPVILDYQGGPEPQGDYGVIGITTFNKLHRDTNNFYKTDTGFEERLKQDYNILITVSFYGNSAYDNAFEAQAVLSYNDVIESFYTFNNISIVDITQIRRIPELRDTGYIQRTTFDIEILIGFESVKQVDWFDTVEWEGTVLDTGGNIVKQWESYANWLDTKLAIEAWVQSADALYNTVNTTLHNYLYSN